MEAAVDDFLKEINELQPTAAFASSVIAPANVDPTTLAAVHPPTQLQRIESLHDYQVGGTTWTPCFDQNSGCPYYWNQVTNEVSWQPPPEYIAAVQAARAQRKMNVLAAQRGTVPAKSIAGLPTGPQPKKSGPKHPWEQDSDSEDEKIELITSFGPQSEDESDDSIVVTAKPRPSKPPKKNPNPHKTAKTTGVIGPHLPPENTVVIGPQLPETADAPRPSGCEDINEVYETSSLLTPLVQDQGPPGAEDVPDSSTNEMDETQNLRNTAPVKNNKSPQPMDLDLSDDEDILSRLKNKAKILEKMGGEVPIGAKELLVCPPSISHSQRGKKLQSSAQSKQAQPSSSFALIANYGDDSDSEEQIPIKKVTDNIPNSVTVNKAESNPSPITKPLFPAAVKDDQPSAPEKVSDKVKPLFPSAVAETTTHFHSHLFPCVEVTQSEIKSGPLTHDSFDEEAKPLDLNSSNDLLIPATSTECSFVAAEIPDSTTTHKAFQRKRRIEFERPFKETPGVKYTMDPTSGEHRGFGFSTNGFEVPNDKTGKSVASGKINFVQGETINFVSAVPEKLLNALSADEATHNLDFSDIDEIAGVLKEKLLFLEEAEGKKEVSAVKLLAIQLETLLSAWHKGALTPAYLSDWCSNRSSELHEKERSAEPVGWTCAWDREKKQYFYKNNDSGDVVWDYPNTEATGCDDVSATTATDAEGKAEEQDETAMELSETPPRASSAPPTPEPPKRDSTPPPPVFSRPPTPPPPPPPLISSRATMEVSSSTTGLDNYELRIPALPTANEPLPPGVDDIEIPVACPPPPGLAPLPPLPPPDYAPPPPDYAPPPPPDLPEINTSVTLVSSSNGTSRKRSILSELDSFYSDLALLEAEPVTTTEQPPMPPSTAAVPDEPVKQNSPVPSTSGDNIPNKRRRKTNKLSSGLALKKKGFNNLVAKWEKAQKEARDDDDDDEDVSSTL